MRRDGETNGQALRARVLRRGALVASVLLFATARALAQHRQPGAASGAPEAPAQPV